MVFVILLLATRGGQGYAEGSSRGPASFSGARQLKVLSLLISALARHMKNISAVNGAICALIKLMPMIAMVW